MGKCGFGGASAIGMENDHSENERDCDGRADSQQRVALKLLRRPQQPQLPAAKPRRVNNQRRTHRGETRHCGNMLSEVAATVDQNRD